MDEVMIRSVICEEIGARGIKQTHVAKNAGMRADSFNAFINGKRKLKAEELIAVSAYLGIPLTRYQTQQPAS
jgi:hypothetical protein